MARKTWQGIVTLLLTVVITLNVRILLMSSSSSWTPRSPSTADDEPGAARETNCDQPITVSIKEQAEVRPLNANVFHQGCASLKDGQVKVIGYPRKNIGFLSIGIPSIKRVNGMSYLLQTVSSVIDGTTTREKTDIVIIVFLSDFDREYNAMVVRVLTANFTDYINMGFLQILQVAQDYYPRLTSLKRNFHDKVDRVTWRAKQAIDFAFMFMYARNISAYHIQIEDDVICVSGFVAAIRKFIAAQKKAWAVLEFSELGFIGKLFRSSDLPKLAQYIWTFYEEQPVDWLITYFRLSMTQKRTLLRKPTLFQHVGLKSSFDLTHDNKLKDRYFDSGEKLWKSDDPAGTVVTNMRTKDTWIPDLAYSSGSGFFWARDVKQGDYLHVIFETEQQLKRVVVETGDKKHPADKLLDGSTLSVSPKLLKFNQEKREVTCANVRNIGEFRGGRVDVDNLDTKLADIKVKCLTVNVPVNQTNWILFQQIAVFIKDPVS